MKRLTVQQTNDLRRVVQSHLGTLEGKLLSALNRTSADPQEIAFYRAAIARTTALLEVLPKRGAVELEEDLSDEQRDEDEDSGDA